MSPYRRNVIVGVVVLGAMVALAWMLIQFGARLVSPFAPATVPVKIVADRADGISNGSAVTYLGVTVGHVETINRVPNEVKVIINAQLDRTPSLPDNLRAVIRSTGIVGSGATIVLELTSPQPEGTLKPGQEIPAKFVGLDIIPPEFGDLARELRQAVHEFRDAKLIDHLNADIERIGKLVDSVQVLVDDPKLQGDVRNSLANIRSATEKADRIATNLEKFSGELHDMSANATDAVVNVSKQINGRLEQISKLLDQFQSIAEKVNNGKGTAGMLVNDNRLYESLVDTAQQLNTTVADLKRLVEQWEQDGVSLKVK
ncbi:MAG TPA: MlaD family protein [Tepidisphaeraceae bacterium]|jgi:phospholipid/cholesterol/gamma-HCH transport system substrate-binding protein